MGPALKVGKLRLRGVSEWEIQASHGLGWLRAPLNHAPISYLASSMHGKGKGFSRPLLPSEGGKEGEVPELGGVPAEMGLG